MARKNTAKKPVTVDDLIKKAVEIGKKSAKKPGKVGLNSPVYRRSDRIFQFIERLKVPSGIGQGTPMKLREWQKDLIRGTYDPTDERGLRRIRRALWSVARKNGKSALAASLLLVHLVGPEAKQNAEVYSVASDRAQAAQVYKMASQMVALDDELANMCKCLDTTKRIVVYELGSFYQSLAADARRLHGFNPTFVIYDELAQAKNRDLYDVMTTSFGAQEEGLFLAISTQSSDPNHIMTELSDEALAQERGELDDPTFYGKVFYLPADVDPFDESRWHEANPALGDFKSIKHMRSLAAKAQRSPSALASFKALELNMRVDATEAFINSVDWKACEGDVDISAMRGKPLYCALDLSSRRDLTAFVMAWDLGDRVATKSFFWTPKDEIAERAKIDGAKYVEWSDAGYMKATEGRTVNYDYVVRFVAAAIDGHDLKSIAYDRWRIDQFKTEAERAGFRPDEWNMSEFGQGWKDMTPAIEKLESLAIEHKLIHDGNPVLTYCMSNVKVTKDAAGNRKFDKRLRNRRIDGAVALAMAVSAIDIAEKPEVIGPSVYEQRGLLVF
jgi:phage terminase large subunit-like protein